MRTDGTASVEIVPLTGCGQLAGIVRFAPPVSEALPILFDEM